MTGAVAPDVEELLTSRPQTAFLATCRDDRPHVAPLWFRYDESVVELVTTGRKLANVRANPRVSLAVQQAEAGVPEWTVTLFGTATVVDSETATREANRRINRRYGVPEESWEAENTLVRIEIGSTSYRTY